MKDTAFEIRYVGNRGVKLWRAVDFNEVNIFENGFLQEFNNAKDQSWLLVAETSFRPGWHLACRNTNHSDKIYFSWVLRCMTTNAFFASSTFHQLT